jgi:hypothetical protein
VSERGVNKDKKIVMVVKLIVQKEKKKIEIKIKIKNPQ